VIVLGFDTALAALSAAVVKDGATLGYRWRELPRGHAEALAPMVDAVMKEAGLAFSDLDRIAVTTGPGTFAGQRVGIAFARGLALATEKPAVGITTLDAMAEAALAECADAKWAAVLSDARRGEVYCGARSRSGETLIAPELIAGGDVAARLRPLAERLSGVALAGTAAEMLTGPLSSAGLDCVLSSVRQPDAFYVARIGTSAVPGAPPKPLYLRPPDARLPT
jgi:tRNA threonylcarbamoyl adenosine modification protein YeaZ